MKRILPIALILIAVAGYFLWKRSHQTDPNRIFLSGNIELKEYQISFKTAGRLMELSVDEGDAVKQGMHLARIDAEQLTQTRDREEAALQIANTQLAQMQTAVAYQRASASGEIELRQAELAQARAQLSALETGSRPQEIQQAEAAAADVRSQHEQAKQDWDRAQQLYKNDDISTQQYDQFRSRFESTRALFRRAQEQLAMVKEGPRKEEIQAARAAVARAEAAVKLAEAQRLSVRQREQEVETRRADINRAKSNVGVFNTQIGDTSVDSPADGVVMVRAAEPGEVIAAGTSVLTIGAIDRPWLRGYIAEQHLGRVKLGQKVILRTDSYPGKEYQGRVSFIASEAEFTPKQIQTQEERVKMVYRIKIDVDNQHRELKNNMPVDAEILLEN